MFSSIKEMVYAGFSVDIIVLSAIALGFLIAFYIYYCRKGKPNIKKNDQLTKKNHPPKVADTITESEKALLVQPNVVTHKLGSRITINGKKCINFASDNFLNLVQNNKITKEAIATIRKYGVGSRGPRGFYGTVDVHFDLEDRIAKFMNMEDAIVNSYWFSTVASVISAYCERHDVIFCDEMVSFAAKKGIDESKCEVIYFKHNHVSDLAKKLKLFNKRTARNKKNVSQKFLLLEGIYYNTGNICNLPHFLDLRSKHQMRVFLDESLSIGVLGNTGRGITEHFNLKPTDIDIIIGSLNGIIGSVGGFCVGNHSVIEHQRLFGLGYCLSASLPLVLTRAAYCAFDYLDDSPICTILRLQCAIIHAKLFDMPNMQVIGNKWSSVKFLRFIDIFGKPSNDYGVYDKFVKICHKEGVAVFVVKNNGNEEWQIKLSINTGLTNDDVNEGIEVMRRASMECMYDIL